MNKNINKFYIIYNDLKNYANDEFTTDDLIKATNDLIKYSKNDFIETSFLKNYDNDNRKRLDKIFTTNQKFLPIEKDLLTYEEREVEENKSFSKFKYLNNIN